MAKADKPHETLPLSEIAYLVGREADDLDMRISVYRAEGWMVDGDRLRLAQALRAVERIIAAIRADKTLLDRLARAARELA